LAVLLSVIGAAMFGLATIRQHGAVQHSINTERRGHRQSFQAFLRMVRGPAWLLGTLQGLVASGLHVVALALAPLALVQPIGVLAVPVTVVASAVKERRRPTRLQVAGSALSVVSIAALTILLLAPATGADVTIPGVWPVTLTTALALAATVASVIIGRLTSPLVRCALVATAAAVLFGLASTLIRTIGRVIVAGISGHGAVLASALLEGVVVVLVGVWAQQRAYISGSPHVVICCLTLIDPLTAVALGRVLLKEAAAISSATFAGVAVCSLLAAAGVVMLSRDYPAELSDSPEPEPDKARDPAREQK
jgi:hypothetical protein